MPHKSSIFSLLSFLCITTACNNNSSKDLEQVTAEPVLLNDSHEKNMVADASSEQNEEFSIVKYEEISTEQEGSEPSERFFIAQSEEISIEQDDGMSSGYPASSPHRKNHYSLKARGAFFFPSGSLTRHIYGQYSGEYSLEFNYSFRRHASLFLNTSIYRKNGRSVGLEHKTTVTLVPVTLGINAQFGHSSFWHPYLGAGLGFAYLNCHDHSKYVKQHVSKLGFASFYQAGMEFDLNRWLFLDLFGAYQWNWFNYHRKFQESQVGGWQVGAGIGCRF